MPGCAAQRAPADTEDVFLSTGQRHWGRGALRDSRQGRHEEDVASALLQLRAR